MAAEAYSHISLSKCCFSSPSHRRCCTAAEPLHGLCSPRSASNRRRQLNASLTWAQLGAKIELFPVVPGDQAVTDSHISRIKSTSWCSPSLRSRSGLEGLYAAAPSRNSRRMPGSIHISAIQPPLTTPVFLHVAVGKREYSGNVGQDDFSLPVTSLRDSMVMTLYNTDKKLISKTEVKTRTIVELGTTDVVFILHSGGEIILQLQFLLSDEGRKRIQELRKSAMKRKQQELLGNGSELYLQDYIQIVSDIPLSKQHEENVFNIPIKGDQLTLRKSMSLDDLKERVVFSGVTVDPYTKASRDLLLQSAENTPSHEDAIDSKLTHGKPESRSSSNAVKKMISAFEGSSPQGPPSMTRIKSESSLQGMPVPSDTPTNSSNKPSTSGASSQTGIVAGAPGKVSLPSGDSIIGPSSRSGRHAAFGNMKSNVSKNTFESRRRSSSRHDEAAKQSAGEKELIGSKKRSQEKHRRRAIGTSSPAQTYSTGLSRHYLNHPLNYLVATPITWIHPHVCMTTASKQLRDLVELEKLNSVSGRLDVREDTQETTSNGEARSMGASDRGLSDGFPMRNGWLINQGVRAVIVVIACGAVFLNR